jgi:heptosyltransferase-2
LRKIDFSKNKAQTVLAPNWIGDAAMAAPFFASLRANFPDSKIRVIINPWIEGLFENYPWVDEIIKLDKNSFWYLFKIFRFGKFKKKLSSDNFWLLPNSFRSGLIGYLSGAESRIGYSTNFRKKLLTNPIFLPENKSQNLMDYYLGLIIANGLSPVSERISIKIRDDLLQVSRNMLEKLVDLSKRPLIGIHPGAFFGSSKTWNPKNFGLLAERLTDYQGAKVLIFGGPGEKELTEIVVKHSKGKALNLYGRDNLLILPGLLSMLDAFISGDTGPLHIASLVGTPTVSIFGPTDPKLTAPRGSRNFYIYENLDCSPCFKRVCPLHHHDCMEKITISDVENKLKNIL